MVLPFILLAGSLSAAQPLPIGDVAAVVVADDAPPPDRAAAAELVDHLAQATGVTLPIVPAAQAPAGKPLVLLGESEARRKLAPDVDLAGLGPDGIVIESVGPNLVLAGKPPRGTRYAVDTFLEDVVGCRWWTSTESDVPHRPNFVVPPLKVHYTPALRYREVFYRDAQDGRFALRLRHNGHFVRTSAEDGEHLSIIGWCHTSYQFLPPAKYFAAHPDWYAERGGRRIPDDGQLCLSSPGARAEMTKVVLQQLRANPHAGLISVSQNDCGGWCDCPECRAARERAGSQSGPLLEFVNAVAEGVAKEFPDVLVETLAYQDSRKPPRFIKPAPYVVIRLCSIECDYSQPLADGPRNARFAADIAGWRAIAPQLFIWNYVTNFANYLLPHPNLDTLAPDVRFFVANKAVGLFEQGDAGSATGDFVRLRAWVLAHLLWDPSRDEKALTTEFLTGYYGAAAPHLQAWLDRRQAAVKKANIHLGCGRGDTADWLTLADLTAGSQDFDAAERAVADDPVRLARVRRERLPLTLAWLLGDRTLRRQAKAKGLPWAGPADSAATAEAWRQAELDNQVGEYAEGRPFGPYGDAVVARFKRGTAPAECRGLAPDDWVDWQANALTLYSEGNWAARVDDAAASSGKAARMPANHTQWAVQCPLGADLGGETWRVVVMARCVAKGTAAEAAPNAPAMTMGIWDAAGNRAVSGRTVPIADAAGGQYRAFDLGTHKIGPGCYAWVAPANNPDQVEAVLVDRIYAVRAAP
jgi:hypothetical protein